MWQKSLMASAITLSLLAPTLASADVVTDTTGVEITKKTDVKLSYDLVVSDLTSDDYTVAVTKADNDELDKNAMKQTTDMGNGAEITGAEENPYIIVVSLTDAGKAKVKAETGVTFDADSIDIVAEIPSEDSKGTPTYGNYVGTSKQDVPTVSNPIVVATKTDNAGSVSSTSDLKEKIVDAKAKQNKAQNDIKVAEGTENKLAKAGLSPSAGVDLDQLQVNDTAVHRSMAQDKKAFDRAEREKKFKKIAAVGWRVLGVAILVAGGAGAAYAVWRWQKKHKRTNSWKKEH